MYSYLYEMTIVRTSTNTKGKFQMISTTCSFLLNKYVYIRMFIELHSRCQTDSFTLDLNPVYKPLDPQK